MWQAIRDHQKIILVYILVNTIILSVIGFFRLVSMVLRPIDRLVLETTSYSSEQPFGVLSEGEGNEFRKLTTAINSMIQRIDEDKVNLEQTVISLKQANETIKKTQQEMVRTEKLASVGRLSAGLAHEIGNPLGIVLGYLGLLQKNDVSEEEKLEFVKRSEQELNRINTLVHQLLDFSRPLPTSSEPVHIHALLNDLQEMLHAQKKNQDISFDTRLYAQNDLVQGSKEPIKQAFMNFYINAIDAIHETTHPEQGIIVTESKIIQDETGKDMLQVTITDNGCGIAPDHLENIFDPFFTTKAPGKGTGLGLSVSYTIIENNGGSLKIVSPEGQGASIVVELPVASETDPKIEK